MSVTRLSTPRLSSRHVLRSLRSLHVFLVSFSRRLVTSLSLRSSSVPILLTSETSE